MQQKNQTTKLSKTKGLSILLAIMGGVSLCTTNVTAEVATQIDNMLERPTVMVDTQKVTFLERMIFFTAYAAKTKEVSKGETATDVTLASSADYNKMNVGKEGKADGTTANRGGTLTVNKGGEATNTTVNGGKVIVNGIANGVELKENGNGTVTVNRGGIVENLKAELNGSRNIKINSGGKLLNSVSNGSKIKIEKGAEADHLAVNGSDTTVKGKANDITLGSTETTSFGKLSGKLIVTDGGVATNVKVNDGGQLYVRGDADSENGVAKEVQVNQGGTVFVQYLGKIEDATVKEGGIFNTADASEFTAANITLEKGHVFQGSTEGDLTANGGTVTIANNVAKNITLNSFGKSDNPEDPDSFKACGKLTVKADGESQGTVVNDGASEIVKGVANGTTINTGGLQKIWADGIADNTTVNAGGTLKVDEDGNANHTTIKNGGILEMTGGTVTGTLEDGYIFKGSTDDTLTANNNQVTISQKNQII